eukprot:1206196-Pyramimonas_sp.AAC.1
MLDEQLVYVVTLVAHVHSETAVTVTRRGLLEPTVAQLAVIAELPVRDVANEFLAGSPLRHGIRPHVSRVAPGVSTICWVRDWSGSHQSWPTMLFSEGGRT